MELHKCFLSGWLGKMETDRLVHIRYRRWCQSLALCTWKLRVFPHLRLRNKLIWTSFSQSASLIRNRRTWHSDPVAVFGAPESLVGLHRGRSSEQGDQDQLKELYSVSGLGAGAVTWQPLAVMISCKGTLASWKINHKKLELDETSELTCKSYFIDKDSRPEILRQGPRAGGEKQDGKIESGNKDRLY